MVVTGREGAATKEVTVRDEEDRDQGQDLIEAQNPGLVLGPEVVRGLIVILPRGLDLTAAVPNPDHEADHIRVHDHALGPDIVLDLIADPDLVAEAITQVHARPGGSITITDVTITDPDLIRRDQESL